MRAASGEIWPFHSREGQFVGLGSHPRLSKATGVSDLEEFRLRGPCGSGGSLRAHSLELPTERVGFARQQTDLPVRAVLDSDHSGSVVDDGLQWR